MGERLENIKKGIEYYEAQQEAIRKKYSYEELSEEISKLDIKIKRSNLHIERLEEELAKVSPRDKDLISEYERQIKNAIEGHKDEITGENIEGRDELLEQKEKLEIDLKRNKLETKRNMELDLITMESEERQFLTQSLIGFDKEEKSIKLEMNIILDSMENFKYEYEEKEYEEDGQIKTARIPKNGEEYKKLHDEYNERIDELKDLREARALCQKELEKFKQKDEQRVEKVNEILKRGSEKTQSGPEEPQQGSGEPQQGSGEPQQGSGEPQQGSGEPQQGPGEPQPGPGEPQPDPERKLKVVVNQKTGKYLLVDENGKTASINMDMDKNLLTRRGKAKFEDELADKYASNKIFENKDEEEIATALAYVDPNLFKLYEMYDKQNNTHLCDEYIKAIDTEKTDDMPTKVKYDLRRRKAEKRIIAPLAKFRLGKIANNHEELGLAEVERDPKRKLGKLIGLITAGGVAALVAGGVAHENNMPEKPQETMEHDDTKDLEDEKDDTDKDLDDEKEHENEDIIGTVLDGDYRQNEGQGLGCGSEITLKGGTYYYDSEGSKPTGKIENRNNGNPVKVKINMIATVKDGVYQNVDFENTIEQIKQENPGCEIQVHIENAEGGDLGWMSESDLKQSIVEKEKSMKESLKVDNKDGHIEKNANANTQNAQQTTEQEKEATK